MGGEAEGEHDRYQIAKGVLGGDGGEGDGGEMVPTREGSFPPFGRVLRDALRVEFKHGEPLLWGSSDRVPSVG